MTLCAVDSQKDKVACFVGLSLPQPHAVYLLRMIVDRRDDEVLRVQLGMDSAVSEGLPLRETTE